MSIQMNGHTDRYCSVCGHLLRALFILFVPALLLTACSEDTHNDLITYVQEIKARKPGRIPSIPEVKEYQAYAYKKEELRDPFKVTTDEAFVEATSGAGLQPDTQRNKEPLESFPMDSLRFVGHMEQEGRVWAVITAPDALVYRVEEGNYLGTNFGRIVGISETQIDVREIVPDGAGGWVERDATLTLEE